MGTSSPDVGGAETVTVRYWAGARAAAGVEQDVLAGVATVEDLLSRLLAVRPGLASVLPVCAVLGGGRAGTGDDPVPAGSVVEVLPPFAGG